jgi:hypothetical protein
MILPSKHINISESLLGLGGFLLNILQKQPLSIDSLWTEYSTVNNKQDIYPAYHSFDNVILAVDLLFIIGAIDINSDGRLYRV